MVRTERLELSHLAAPEPKSGVSTNSTTSADSFKYKNARLGLAILLKWGGRWGSNPRHQEPQSCALPTELRPPLQQQHQHNLAESHHAHMARPAGFEPATTRLEGGCSIQLSYGRLTYIINPEGLKCWSLIRLPNRLRCVCEAGRIILSPSHLVNDLITFFSNI